jgi:Family of unknown function (DUF5985)
VIEFLSGAVTLGYSMAGVCFLRFWRKTRDRLFLHFSFAFWLFAMNQLLTAVLTASDERTGYVYVLRVLGFVLILVGIGGKNSSLIRRK